jgi:hypothetical protein
MGHGTPLRERHPSPGNVTRDIPGYAAARRLGALIQDPLPRARATIHSGTVPSRGSDVRSGLSWQNGAFTWPSPAGQPTTVAHSRPPTKRSSCRQSSMSVATALRITFPSQCPSPCAMCNVPCALRHIEVGEGPHPLADPEKSPPKTVTPQPPPKPSPPRGRHTPQNGRGPAPRFSEAFIREVIRPKFHRHLAFFQARSTHIRPSPPHTPQSR